MAEITQETVEEYLADIEQAVIADFGGDALKEVLKVARADMRPFVTNSQRTQQFLREKFGRNMKEITASTRREVSKALNEGIALGEDYNGLSKRLGKSFDHLSRSRQRTIATTEVGAAANFAIDEGYRQSGLVSKRRWVTTFLRSRPTHEKLSGEERGMDEDFSTINGSAQYPGDFGVAAEDINCRCRTVAAKFTSDETTEDVTLRKDPVTGEITRDGKPVIPTTPEPIPVPKPRPPAPEPPETAPVSAALERPGGQVTGLDTSIDDAINTIDSVHSDGDLPKIPIGTADMAGGTNGRYYFDPKNGKAVGIDISNDVDHRRPQLTTAHEVGHFLDNQVLKDKGGRHSFGSEQATKEFLPVLRAIQESPQYKELGRMKRRALEQFNPSLPRAVNMELAKIEIHVDYLLDAREAWARAYAQYIAEKSGNPVMLKELGAIVDSPMEWSVRHWETKDFAPIRDAIDTMFRDKGWIR